MSITDLGPIENLTRISPSKIAGNLLTGKKITLQATRIITPRFLRKPLKAHFVDCTIEGLPPVRWEMDDDEAGRFLELVERAV